MIRKPVHILRALGLALLISAGSAHADGLVWFVQLLAVDEPGRDEIDVVLRATIPATRISC